jgi:DNA-binding CsgD family transcriptional regulator
MQTLSDRCVVGARRPHYAPAMEAAADGNHDGLTRLTARESEILHRTSLGQTNAQVADDLGVTVHAVKFHLASIFRKLDVQNRTQAAAVYLRGSPR